MFHDYISKISIKNLKKFEECEFEFNQSLNVIIGENAAGKSSILQAINIVLNQKGIDDSKFRNDYGMLMNKNAENVFIDDPKKSTLPKIEITVYLHLSNEIPNHIFSGIDSNGELSSFIKFEYSYNDDFDTELQSLIEEGDTSFVPYEFYQSSWKTATGPYHYRKNPLKSIVIDTDKADGDSFSSYKNQIYNSLSVKTQSNLSTKLKTQLSVYKEDITSLINGDLNLQADPSRILVRDTLEIFSKDKPIPLRQEGSGVENIIKTEIALKSESKLVLLEEPENHLTFDLAMRQIQFILDLEKSNRQVILTTHNPLIVNRLNLKNVLLLTDNRFLSLKSLDEDTALYFSRLDNLNILQFMLAKKVILVEGPTEYIVMDTMFKATTNTSLTDEGIHLLSMGGDHAKRFIEVAKMLKNKVLIITDNDGNDARRQSLMSLIETLTNVKLSIPENTAHFTFEAALFYSNQEWFQSDLWKHHRSKTEWGTHKELPKELVYMLNNKVDSALEYDKQIQEKNILVPNYLCEDLEWFIE